LSDEDMESRDMLRELDGDDDDDDDDDGHAAFDEGLFNGANRRDGDGDVSARVPSGSLRRGAQTFGGKGEAFRGSRCACLSVCILCMYVVHTCM
jgi:hypothetical protein